MASSSEPIRNTFPTSTKCCTLTHHILPSLVTTCLIIPSCLLACLLTFTNSLAQKLVAVVSSGRFRALDHQMRKRVEKWRVRWGRQRRTCGKG
jgi:hypothetical protein